MLVLGTGGRVERIDAEAIAFLRKKGIAVEVQDTVRSIFPLGLKAC